MLLIHLQQENLAVEGPLRFVFPFTSPHPPIGPGPVAPGTLCRQPSLHPPPLWILLAEVLSNRAWSWGLLVQRTLMPSDSTGQSKGQAASVNS